MSEWISVEDRLPKIGETVLVFESKVLIATYKKSGFVQHCFDLEHYAEYTTHWQPLPEPPKPTNLIDSFIADGGFDRVMGCKNGE